MKNTGNIGQPIAASEMNPTLDRIQETRQKIPAYY